MPVHFCAGQREDIMASVVRSIARHTPRLVLLGCFAASTPATSLPPTTDRAGAAATTLSLSYYPEVRLRKLHLVRPDLIPYPIAYEVYC